MCLHALFSQAWSQLMNMYTHKNHRCSKIFLYKGILNNVEEQKKTISQHQLGCPPINNDLIKNSQAVKKGTAPNKAMVKKDVKSKVAAKKWL